MTSGNNALSPLSEANPKRQRLPGNGVHYTKPILMTQTNIRFCSPKQRRCEPSGKLLKENTLWIQHVTTLVLPISPKLVKKKSFTTNIKDFIQKSVKEAFLSEKKTHLESETFNFEDFKELELSYDKSSTTNTKE